MRNRSPANKAASSPPVPARISSIADRSSATSLGNSKMARSCSATCLSWLTCSNSSTAMSRSSLSADESFAIASSVSISARRRRTSCAILATGSISAYSLDAVTKASPSIVPDAIRASSSAKRASIWAMRWGDIWVIFDSQEDTKARRNRHPNPTLRHSREGGNPTPALSCKPAAQVVDPRLRGGDENRSRPVPART